MTVSSISRRVSLLVAMTFLVWGAVGACCTSREYERSVKVLQESKRLDRVFVHFLYDLYDHVNVRNLEDPCDDCSLAEVVFQVSRSSDLRDIDELYRSELADGKDVWGHAILFWEERDGVWKIRSVGPNGLDEGGKGDDVEASIDLHREVDELIR
ncbi:hypothetical protein GCM10023155_45470 [Bremerella cremea]